MIALTEMDLETSESTDISQSLFGPENFFYAQQFLDRDMVGTCQLNNFFASGQVSRSFPIHQSRARDSCYSRNLSLGKVHLRAKKMEPSSVGISPRLWFSSHVARK